jgi:hypothetical protein
MKKITLATILLGTAVYLTPVQASNETALMTEEQQPSKAYVTPDATPEGMLFQTIARRIERYDGNSFGLDAVTDGTPLYLLKVMNRPSFDLFASIQGDLKFSTTRKIDDRGWVKIGQTYYAVREDEAQSDVPVVSSFMGRLRQSPENVIISWRSKFQRKICWHGRAPIMCVIFQNLSRLTSACLALFFRCKIT